MDNLFFAHLLNSLLMIGIPICLAIYLTQRWKLSWRLWLLGGMSFILSQVGHIPFNMLMTSLLSRTPLANLSPNMSLIFNAIFLGLSAGLFEELVRYAILHKWLKDARSWRKAILFGAGHGGVEAIILGSLALYAFLQLATLRSADISTLIPANQLAQAQQQVADYWSVAWYTAMLGAVERLFTLIIQISLAVIVLQTFTRNKLFWVWLAVLYHAVVDTATVLAVPSLGIFWTEAIIGGFALFSLGIIFALRQPEPRMESGPLQPIPEVRFTPKPVEETPENLDNSRFI
jgi:uncharacterized membrane protein YhfC